MRKILKYFLAGNSMVLLATVGSSQTDTWVQRDSIKGAPKSACVAFTAYTSGFVGTGFDLTEYKRSFFRYDPVYDDWDRVASLGDTTGGGLERSSAVAFSLYNMGYVGLGQGMNPFFDDFWRYDPGTDTWTQVADFGGTARTMAVAFAIDTAAYVGTGVDANGLKNDFWRYSPALNQWFPVSNFPGTARKQAVGVAMGGLGYVGTGNDGTFTKDFFIYTPATDTWSVIADFGGTARYSAAAFAVYPCIYVGTGYDNNLAFKQDVWEFNLWTGTWTQRASFAGSPRSNAIAFSIGQKGYLGSGYDGDLKDDFYEYTVPLGIHPPESDDPIVCVYPNPVSGQVNLETGNGNELESWTLYNAQGKIIAEGRIYRPMVHTLQLNMENTPSGTYLWQGLLRTGARLSARIMVTR